MLSSDERTEHLVHLARRQAPTFVFHFNDDAVVRATPAQGNMTSRGGAFGAFCTRLDTVDVRNCRSVSISRSRSISTTNFKLRLSTSYRTVAPIWSSASASRNRSGTGIGICPQPNLGERTINQCAHEGQAAVEHVGRRATSSNRPLLDDRRRHGGGASAFPEPCANAPIRSSSLSAASAVSFTLVRGDRLGNGHVQDPVEDFKVTGRDVVDHFPRGPVTTAQTDP